MQAGVKERYDAFADACAENGHNASEAARIAGYSVKSANRTAHKLLSIVYIKDRIAKKAEELRLKAEVTVEEGRQKLRQMEALGLKLGTLGGYNLAVKCVELELKTSGLLIDRSISDTSEERKQLDEKQKVEARKMANILNLQDARKGA